MFKEQLPLLIFIIFLHFLSHFHPELRSFIIVVQSGLCLHINLLRFSWKTLLAEKKNNTIKKNFFK